MAEKIKVGVLGAHRGLSMIGYCRQSDNAELVAVCDKAPYELDRVRRELDGLPISYYDNFEDFIRHDMDAVVLANYANEHAPFAIRAMNEGKHVFSEVLPVQTLRQAVELVETVEKTGLVYAYGENYCYMAAPMEMRKLYREGRIGEFEYGEGEYVHNCESIWPEITYGEPDHWRNNMFSTFYCTHSLGPIIHITGLRPVSVTGFEPRDNRRRFRTGARCGEFGLEMVTMENGAVVKSIHGDLYKNNISYVVYGSKGRMESARHDTENGSHDRIFVNADEYDGEYPEHERIESYLPAEKYKDMTGGFGHGGSDFWSMYWFIERIKGDENADTIDVYEALDMCLPGIFAYRSILAGGAPMAIPDLRDKTERDKWRNDIKCTDPNVASGDDLLPTAKGGTPDIPQEIYDNMREKWEKILAKRSGNK
ncbi:MAG: Gfo/Idh/MocA family oxidoreductase [Clostridia bacterium]|nr:Gfo/Idh/MocA family oxidoreductase [Clostridia bacterium]